jgi:hypothetical protein
LSVSFGRRPAASVDLLGDRAISEMLKFFRTNPVLTALVVVSRR